MQIQAIGGILYDCGGKMGSNCPDLEPGKKFQNRFQVPSSNYKSLMPIAPNTVYNCMAVFM